MLNIPARIRMKSPTTVSSRPARPRLRTIRNCRDDDGGRRKLGGLRRHDRRYVTIYLVSWLALFRLTSAPDFLKTNGSHLNQTE